MKMVARDDCRKELASSLPARETHHSQSLPSGTMESLLDPIMEAGLRRLGPPTLSEDTINQDAFEVTDEYVKL